MLWHIKRGLLLPQSLALNSRQGTPKKNALEALLHREAPQKHQCLEGGKEKGKGDNYNLKKGKESILKERET